MNYGLLRRIKVARFTFLQLLKDRINNRSRSFKEEMIRASGDCVCEICDEKYYDHFHDTTYEFLNVRCDGQRLKL